MRCRLRHPRGRNPQAGMSLIELMIAGVVLVVGFAGVMALIINAIGSNSRNKKDTSASAVVQMVLERIQTLPEGSNVTTTVTDCAGTTWTISSVVGSGANLTGASIDFTQDFTAVPANYKMKYAVCDANTGQKTTYDVRWNIATGTTHTSYVVIGARPLNLRYFALPVTIRAMVGQ